ncbi:putative Uncharacterized oxidoreductase [Glarea lozoyensis 74030]|uniref:Putative Uncharacterized oxidoreductase n=1 Tax=Glarea lozoyensis (strain ATCC 74030 / MF5533) TaxID=1104152 RepID=H0ERW8_GLAL7|nr:putative Uncharacterized oxidoreductase [Glarea lozoyensis 74030]
MKMHPFAKIDLLEMDLMDLASVVAAAKHFLAIETALHGLVNNAGIMATPFKMTKDNYETQWQTNYLSHWVFTEHLLPLMRQTAKSLPPGSRYGPGSPSARDGKGEIWLLSVHPGLVETNLGESIAESGSMIVNGVFSVFRKLGFFSNADEGSWTSLYGVANWDMKAEQSGDYFEVHRRFGEPRWQSAAAKDAKLAERLDEWTREEMKKQGWVS